MFNIKELPFYDVLPMGVCDFNLIKKELLDCRAKARIPENAKSIITVLFPYYLGEKYYINQNLSKYAVPNDYHKICGDYLEKIAGFLREKYKDNTFSFFCDNSPIPEVKTAALCGLGVIGENTLLINKEYGSFCFIGEIVTDLEIESNNTEIKFCTNCGKCKSECINSAVKNQKIDKSRCLSEITQKKGGLTEEEKTLIKRTGIIWGCDICQNVCPLNKEIKASPIKEFYSSSKAQYNGIDDYKKEKAFSWRKSDVIERNFKIISCKSVQNKV